MGTQRVQIKGVLPWLVRSAYHASTGDFCFALAALVSPVQNMFFLTVHYFNSFVLITQAAVLGRLSISTYVSLVKTCFTFIIFKMKLALQHNKTTLFVVLILTDLLLTH
jgi:hypothetical protein